MLWRGLTDSSTVPYPEGLFNHYPQCSGLEKHPEVPIVAFSPNVAPPKRAAGAGQPLGLSEPFLLSPPASAVGG